MINQALTLERSVQAYGMVADFLIVGKCPDGVRPVVLEALANIIALAPRPFKFPAQKWAYRIVDHRGREFCFTNDEVYAARLKRRGYRVS